MRETHTMRPVHSDLSDLNASARRCTNAVERMTPVTKCLPRKNTMDGMRMYLVRFDTEGNETADKIRDEETCAQLT